MVNRKTIFLLLLVGLFFAGQQKKGLIIGVEHQPTEQIEVRRHFNCYNHRVDWNTLIDLENNPILNICLTGAESEELEKLGIKDLESRLEKLQRGNLIRKVGCSYKLAFPSILGEKRTKLQRVVEQTASEVLPAAEEMTRDIIPHLKGYEGMLYHVVWSILMDSPLAWQAAEAELRKQLKKNNISLGGTNWLMYPSHPYRAGTNTYTDLKQGPIKITWSLNTPTPPVVHKTIKKYENQLMQSAMEDQPLKDQEAKQALARYGLIDGQSVSQVYIIDTSSQAAQIYGKLSSKFGKTVMEHFDTEKMTDLLEIPPEQAVVIVYHEICYEILKQLSAKNILEVPQIVLKPKVETTQMYRLISFIHISDSNHEGRGRNSKARRN